MKASKQTRLKLRKGFVNAPIKYKVLAVTQFTPEAMKEIAKGLIHATTPVKANDLLPKPGKPSKWSIRNISLVGDFNVVGLFYLGLEVAAFWKRQTSEVIPDPEDPVPEGIVEHPDDVWVRFDLLYKSARQLTLAVSDSISKLQEYNLGLEIQVAALKRVLESNGQTIKSLQGEVTALKAKRKRK